MTINKLNLPAKENAVQSKINEIIDNNADTTLSNVSSISNNSAVQTALDGKVSKSGDTMTGNLTISEDATAKIELTNTSFDPTSTTAPASNLYAGAIDISGLDNYHVGHFRTRHNTGNYFQSQMGVKRNINNTDYEANITVAINPDGKSSCSFPNTTCCDGQYVALWQEVASDVNVYNANNADTGWYTVNIPEDGYDYMVWFRGQCVTDTTSGHVSQCLIKSDIETAGAVVSQIGTRTNASVASQGTVCIPVSSNRRIKLARASNRYGTMSVRMIGYRRIGTNS